MATISLTGYTKLLIYVAYQAVKQTAFSKKKSIKLSSPIELTTEQKANSIIKILILGVFTLY